MSPATEKTTLRLGTSNRERISPSSAGHRGVKRPSSFCLIVERKKTAKVGRLWRTLYSRSGPAGAPTGGTAAFLAWSATTPRSNGRPPPINADRSARPMPFAKGDASRKVFRAYGATSPCNHRTLTRLTGEGGRSSMVGEYVPEFSQPQAAHRSENKPPCIERST